MSLTDLKHEIKNSLVCLMWFAKHVKEDQMKAGIAHYVARIEDALNQYALEQGKGTDNGMDNK